ncbi:hypothetical protein, partial [uncultured Desulfovibrio sp.]|uniref:hypothetical protein n=1 Tax=uncultured Desulfovibrio sp. TaxID=167968 RepID=UPI0026DACB92
RQAFACRKRAFQVLNALEDRFFCRAVNTEAPDRKKTGASVFRILAEAGPGYARWRALEEECFLKKGA